jgi:hypothetical protein
MLKRIPKSDISVRPFKAYKQWAFDNDSTEITVLEAVSGDYTSTDSNILTSGSLSGSSYNKRSLYGQLRAQFYNGNEDNPFTRTGHKSSFYTDVITATERFLSSSAKVISIPNIYVGEGIKKKSVTFYENNISYTDDGNGNLYDSKDTVIISSINSGNSLDSVLIFKDIIGNEYYAKIDDSVINDSFFDIETNKIILNINSVEYTALVNTIDLETGIMIVDNFSFLPEQASGLKIGNVFYNQGLVTITRNPELHLIDQWDLTFKSTETIYEHEYLLIVNESDYNVSTNPSAVSTVGGVYETFIDDYGKAKRVYTEQPVKYIKKLTTLENGTPLDFRFSGSVGTTKAGFEHYDLSGSVDSTGSFLAPFITTIGLYDDDCDLVAVAKLPKPIKSDPEIPVNFIVRFDT